MGQWGGGQEEARVREAEVPAQTPGWMLRPCTVVGRLREKQAEETIKACLENGVKVPQKKQK